MKVKVITLTDPTTRSPLQDFNHVTRPRDRNHGDPAPQITRLAGILSRFFDKLEDGGLPRPFGVFYQEDRFRYEEALQLQIDEAMASKGEGDLDALLAGNNNWVIQ